MSDNDNFDTQPWNITFIGGTADLDGTLTPHENSFPDASLHKEHLPLSMVSVSDRVWVTRIKGGRTLQRRLTDVGIVQGCEITVVSRTESGSVIVALAGCRIGLGAGMAHQIIVSTAQIEISTASKPIIQETTSKANSTVSHLPTSTANQEAQPSTPLQLGALTVGQSGRIIGFEKGIHRPYRDKLLSMGLTPGVELTVTRQAPLGDPIEILVRGYKLSLRKGEAAILKVEILTSREGNHDA